MEVNSGEPFAIREIDTIIDLVTKTETKINPITKTRTNMTEVEEVISLANPTLACDFVAQDFAPQTFQQTLNDQD
jgi:hypothetical protein